MFVRLSLTQKKLLKLLALNCRFSHKDLGRSIGISSEAVDYQITNLFEKKKIGTFNTQFNYSLLGFDHYHYLIRVKDLSKLSLSLLQKLTFVPFINTSYGKYDLQLIVVAKNDDKLQEYISKIENLLKDNIQDFLLIKFIEQYRYTHILPELHIPVTVPTNQKKFTYSITKENFAENNFKQKNLTTLDKIDYSIIKCLIKEPSVSYMSMSRALNLSHETIRYRVKKLIQEGLITHFGVFFDYKLFGYFLNYILIKITSQNNKKIKAYLSQNKHILYAAKLNGSYNYIIYILSKNSLEFGRQVKKIRMLLSSSILDIELLTLDEIIKSTQFPEVLFSAL